MSKIVFKPSGRSVEAPPGASLLDAARLAAIELDAPCGGAGSCGKCIVRVESGRTESEGEGILPDTAVKEGYALACRTRALDSLITVEVTEPVSRSGGQFVEDGEADWLDRNDLRSMRERPDPLVHKNCLVVPMPQIEDGLSDVDRLIRSIQKIGGNREVDCPLSVVRFLAGALRAEDGKVTVALTLDSSRIRIFEVEPGDRTADQFGIAVDVGTTTVAVQLVNLRTAQIESTRADYNFQITCGLDVISRIQYARNPARLEDLRVRALGTINNLIRKLARGRSLKPEEILAAVVAGNTTMIHLLLGLNPEFIRLEPYTPTLHAVPELTAVETGVHIHPRAPVLLCPSVGSYVGGDITAGLLCTDLAEDGESVRLFIDIGTNGELAVGNRDFLIVCACSAGPAFEGGGIEHGMRAASGAIEQVDVDPETGASSVRTIGGGKPVGICGSGMVSLLAGLFLTGWIDPAGKFNRSKMSPAIRIDGRRALYTVVPEKESGTGRSITIGETDVENVIRAKAAIYAAIRLLLRHVGMEADQIETFYIAGGFGRFLDLENAVAIGLIPDIPRDRYRYLGNTSLAGAALALVSREHRERLFALSRRMTYIELNSNPEYMDQYTGALFLPHTDMNLFPSVRKTS